MLGMLQGKGAAPPPPQGPNSKPLAPPNPSLQGPAPGSLPGKGGGSQLNPQSPNPGLAALFRNNQATVGPAAPTQLPQITAPVRPNIGMPPPPRQQPTAPTGGTGVNPFMLNGNGRSWLVNNPQLARAAMINFPGKVTPEMEKLARQRGAQANAVWQGGR